MFNLLDILQSQAGPGMETIGQQFGLSPDQSRRAMEALLPALATGLQHSAASDPLGFSRLLGSVGLGGVGMGGFGPGGFGMTPAFDAWPSPQPQPDILGQLFGSPLLNQAVLRQASMASGVGTQALRQMLPVMAGMVVAGILHVLLNQNSAQPAPAPQPEPALPLVRFWNDWMTRSLGAAAPSPQPPPSAYVPAPREASGSVTPRGPAPSLREPSDGVEEAKTPGPEAAPFEALQEMFQTGVQVQEQNAKAMQDIFDAFWPSPLPKSDYAMQPEAPPSTTRRSPDLAVASAKAAKPRAGAGTKRATKTTAKRPAGRGKSLKKGS